MLIALLGLSFFIMNMEEKEISWGDCRFFIGGQEITTFASVDLAVPGSDTSVISEVVSRNGELTFMGTIHISKKEARKLRELCKMKKRRLPRKLKKKLKKQRLLFYELLKYYPQTHEYLNEPIISTDKLVADLNKELSNIVIKPAPILPRDFNSHPGCIIIDDLE